jgi:hypothetical protein
VDQKHGAGGVVREVAREGAVEQALAGPADGRGHEQVGSARRRRASASARAEPSDSSRQQAMWG